jgi:hypothetical protein
LELLDNHNLVYIDCEENRDACHEIEGFPFWKNEAAGEVKLGFQTEKELREMLGHANKGFFLK